MKKVVVLLAILFTVIASGWTQDWLTRNFSAPDVLQCA